MLHRPKTVSPLEVCVVMLVATGRVVLALWNVPSALLLPSQTIFGQLPRLNEIPARNMALTSFRLLAKHCTMQMQDLQLRMSVPSIRILCTERRRRQIARQSSVPRMTCCGQVSTLRRSGLHTTKNTSNAKRSCTQSSAKGIDRKCLQHGVLGRACA